MIIIFNKLYYAVVNILLLVEIKFHQQHSRILILTEIGFIVNFFLIMY